jgi:transposase
MRAQLKRAGAPGSRAIGIDEISVQKGHSYRIVVNDLVRKRPIWFGGGDRSEACMPAFYDWLGLKKSRKIELAVMDRWKPFRKATKDKALQAAILFNKFHIMRHLGEALDKVRKAEYADSAAGIDDSSRVRNTI